MAIVGCGGFGREVLSIIAELDYEPIGFLDADPKATAPGSLPVLGDDSLLKSIREKYDVDSVFIAIGDIGKRRELSVLAQECGLNLPEIIHPSARILTEHPVGNGSIIYPGAVIMSNCSIGSGVIINSAATLGHDTVVCDYCNINPGVNIAGKVTVKEQVFVGMGAAICENLTVGKGAVVGAGSVVLKSVPDNAMVCGVPAEVSKLIPEE